MNKFKDTMQKIKDMIEKYQQKFSTKEDKLSENGRTAVIDCSDENSDQPKVYIKKENELKTSQEQYIEYYSLSSDDNRRIL